MSEYLDAIQAQAALRPHALAFGNSRGEQLTYGQLDAQSNSLAAFLIENYAPGQSVALLGHKEPEMLVSMLACMKAGFGYVPLDSSLPLKRIEGILGQLDEPVIIETAEHILGDAACIRREELREILSTPAEAPDPQRSITGEDVHYILFTSGSTGTPKGVVQPARSMDCTYRYFSRFIPEGEELTFFNRAHYSFDLSLFDLAIALPFGHALFALTEEAENSLSATFDALRKANPALWVSTPSYLDMCLVDPQFSPELLPDLRCVVVCGETLHNSTAQRLLERFPGVRLYNTYGPTETQAAVTDVLITREIAETPEALSVGSISPYNELWIVDTQTGERLATGETGEVVIAGGTVAQGYLGREDLTSAAFGIAGGKFGEELPFYRTGDEGYIDEAGQLHYLGRLDLQVKVNGYRIELEEIEETLNRIPGVFASCVVPVERRGANVALAAHVVLENGSEGTRETTKQLKEELKKTLPSYMIPRTIAYHEALPVNANGKTDRKALQSMGAQGNTRARGNDSEASSR